MKGLTDHIENVRAKPHHVRKRIAFSAAGACTALVAIIWASTSLSTGAFELQPTSFAANTGSEPVVASAPAGSNENLAGAGAAAAGNAPEQAKITIVDVQATTTATSSEPTTIPF